MSEDMSDRMPEDVPVRTCINVMVGITRSKVIFFKDRLYQWWIFHIFHIFTLPTVDISYFYWGYTFFFKPIEIVDFPMKNGGSFHIVMLVYQRVSP